jgi:hypothetical protein
MRARNLAIWTVVAVALAWALMPVAIAAAHSTPGASATTTGLQGTTMADVEHGCHTSSDSDHANNGIGNDEDHDHDCSEDDAEDG